MGKGPLQDICPHCCVVYVQDKAWVDGTLMTEYMCRVTEHSPSTSPTCFCHLCKKVKNEWGKQQPLLQPHDNTSSYFWDCCTVVSSNSLYSFGMKYGFFLLWSFIHEANIPFLSLQYTWEIHLEMYIITILLFYYICIGVMLITWQRNMYNRIIKQIMFHLKYLVI